MSECPHVFVDASADAQLAAVPAPRRALFLDRDGVINVDHGYVHSPDATVFVDGIFDLCRAARAQGRVLVVATNQAGIGRGFYDEVAFLDYTRWLHEVFAREGAPLLATCWCPHHATAGLGDYLRDCPCRKPAPGMLHAAIARFGIDAAGSVMIGDKDSDLVAARAAGVGCGLLFGDGGEAAAGPAQAIRIASLADATIRM